MNGFFPYSGHFIFIDYYPYKGNDEWDLPVKGIRVRIQDLGNSDIGEAISREYLENDGERLIRKYDTRIQMLPSRRVKPQAGDKVKIPDYDKIYYVKEVGFGWDSISMLDSLQFKRMNRQPSVLYLGDRR